MSLDVFHAVKRQPLPPSRTLWLTASVSGVRARVHTHTHVHTDCCQAYRRHWLLGTAPGCKPCLSWKKDGKFHFLAGEQVVQTKSREALGLPWAELVAHQQLGLGALQFCKLFFFYLPGLLVEVAMG